MYAIEEGIAVVVDWLHGMSYEEVQNNFMYKFHKAAPTRHSIKNLANKFIRIAVLLMSSVGDYSPNPT